MVDTTMEKIKEIINSRNFSNFVHLKENLYFDAKREQYDAASPSSRYEIAKDVSAFANSEGGYIVIGLNTKRIDEQLTEEVESLNLLQEETFNVGAHKSIIAQFIYPSIRCLEVEWVESMENPGIGIGYILIPKQDEREKYFLTNNTLEENEPVKQIVFGLARRIDSSSIPLGQKEIYLALQTGKSAISERLTIIEKKLIRIEEAIKKSIEAVTDGVDGIPGIASGVLFPGGKWSRETIEEKLAKKIKDMKLFDE